MTAWPKALRILQGVLLLAAALTGLSWLEASPQETTETGRQTLSLSYEAEAIHPRQPWDASTVFTEEHAGIPLDVAPILNVTAHHAARGIRTEDPVWSAALEIQATGDEGRHWWRDTEPVGLAEDEDGVVHAEINLSRVLSRAREAERQADVPQRLELQLRIEHHATSIVAGDPRPSSHVATLQLDPREDHVVLHTRDDESAYATASGDGFDPKPLFFLVPAALLEAPIRYLRRNEQPWQQVWGVDALPVHELDVQGARRTDLDSLLGAARRGEHPLLVDEPSGRALWPQGDGLWAWIQDPSVSDEGKQDDEE